MKLEFACELAESVYVSAYWWHCIQATECTPKGDGYVYIPAPEYDWLYWWAGVPEEELHSAFNEEPALQAEYDEMRARYLKRNGKEPATESVAERE